MIMKSLSIMETVDVVTYINAKIRLEEDKAKCNVHGLATQKVGKQVYAQGLLKMAVMVSPDFYIDLRCSTDELIESVVDFTNDPATIYSLPLHIDYNQQKPYRMIVR